MEYYDVSSYGAFDDSWLLDAPRAQTGEIWPEYEKLFQGKLVSDRQEILLIQDNGREVDAVLSTDCLLCVKEWVGLMISDMCQNEVQLLPARTQHGTRLFLVHLLCVLDCFDYEKSVYDGGKRNRKVYGLSKLVVDPTRTEARRILRMKNMLSVVLMAEDLVNALRAAGVTGLRWSKVT